MNSKERVRSTLAWQEPDRVPVFEQEIASNIASAILRRDTYTGGGGIGWRQTAEFLFQQKRDTLVERLSRDLVDLHEKLDMDLVRAPVVPEKGSKGPQRKLDENTYYYEDDELGTWSVMRYEPRTMMFSVVDSCFRKNDVTTVERFVEGLLEKGIGLEASAFEVMEKIREEIGHHRATCAASGIGIPLEAAWIKTLYVKPELIESYLDHRVRQEKALIHMCSRHGVEFILGGGDIASNSGPFFSPRTIRRLIVPRVKQIVEFCHELSLSYLYRTDGNVWTTASELFEQTGADGYGEIDAQAGMKLSDLRRRFPRLILWGNIDCAKTLVLGSRKQVIDETVSAIKDAAPGGGYILGSSNTIHPTVKVENFLAMLEAARTYGSYPICIA